MILQGHAVLDRELIFSDGSLSRIRYWIPGHHDLSSMNTTVKFIHGYTGKETEVTVNIIAAQYVFERKAA